MTIERAQLAMQLASQIRTKGVEALQEVFRTSV
jgi:flagellar hook-basal body complex protein FliE